MTLTLLDDPALFFEGRPPERVVSLVPSVTESLFDLGAGGSVTAITDYCVYPSGRLDHLPRVGGPKNPNLEQILALRPDLVIANREENARGPVEALLDAGVPVWLTFPKTVREAVADLWKMARLFRSEHALAQAQMLERSVEWAELARADLEPARYFCPIWQEGAGLNQSLTPGKLLDDPAWWMTFNDDTYSGDLLRLLGGANVFAARQRRYPLAADLGLAPAEEPAERDTRYPRVTLAEITAAQPEVILLPDEPYEFDEASQVTVLACLNDTPAGQNGRIRSLDGSLITWPGTRLGLALNLLGDLFFKP